MRSRNPLSRFLFRRARRMKSSRQLTRYQPGNTRATMPPLPLQLQPRPLIRRTRVNPRFHLYSTGEVALLLHHNTILSPEFRRRKADLEPAVWETVRRKKKLDIFQRCGLSNRHMGLGHTHMLSWRQSCNFAFR